MFWKDLEDWWWFEDEEDINKTKNEIQFYYNNIEISKGSNEGGLNSNEDKGL